MYKRQEGSTPVYYNPDGGTYYHLDPDCASVAKEWRDRFEEFPYDSLFKSHWYLLPCSACVDEMCIRDRDSAVDRGTTVTMRKYITGEVGLHRERMLDEIG